MDETLKQLSKDSDLKRIWDLLRLMRFRLHDENAISNEEYALLAQDHPAVERLETYDKMKADLAALRERAEKAEARVVELTLELSRLRVKPITDKEIAGEGDFPYDVRFK